MAITYQAQNWIEFHYDYVDQDGATIDISTASSVTLYIRFPDGETVEVVGSYMATADLNRAYALVKIIDNQDLNTTRVGKEKEIKWQFKVVLPPLSEPIWSPVQSLEMLINLAN